ncbi:MAG: alpha/beta hydrolase [Actinobacteria bacterium]|nr:alpha/beta hydrolase [Actinomycetota bacterium]
MIRESSPGGHKGFVVFALGLLFVLSTACGDRSDQSAEPSEKDVTYCTADGVALEMDLYFPKATDSGSPAPVVVYVHGGGWQRGDKSVRSWKRSVVEEFTARGYLVAAIDYRLAPQYEWPAQIEDVKCAVRYLRANASMYHLDPDRIGAWGGSAGGHLVALLGLTDANAGLEGQGGYAEQSSRVQAVVDMFGPTDLTAGDFAGNARASKKAKSVFGGSAEALMRASPVNYVSKDAPPFFILHGEKDPLVPPAQSQELYDRLKAVGVPVNLVMVENAGHTLNPAGGSISPGRREIEGMIADFFDQNLRNAE